jgi:hypothetical protein
MHACNRGKSGAGVLKAGGKPGENFRKILGTFFMFRRFTSVGDLTELSPPECYTHLYHMRTDGTLRRACIISGNEL